MKIHKANKIVLFITVCFAILLIPTSFVQAVVIGGWYWENPAIKFYIFSDTSTPTTTAWVNCANHWTVLTSSNVEFTRIYNMQEAGTVFGEVNVAEGWDGLTQISIDNGRVTSAAAVLNCYYTDSYNVLKRLSVASHEVGHILGLGDEGASKQELMNQITNYRYDRYKISTPQPVELYAIDNVIYREIVK